MAGEATEAMAWEPIAAELIECLRRYQPRLFAGGGSGADSGSAGGPQFRALSSGHILRLEGMRCPAPSDGPPSDALLEPVLEIVGQILGFVG